MWCFSTVSLISCADTSILVILVYLYDTQYETSCEKVSLMVKVELFLLTNYRQVGSAWVAFSRSTFSSISPDSLSILVGCDRQGVRS